MGMAHAVSVDNPNAQGLPPGYVEPKPLPNYDLMITVPNADEIAKYPTKISPHTQDGKFLYYRVPKQPSRLGPGRPIRVYVVHKHQVTGFHILAGVRYLSSEDALKLGYGGWAPGWYLIRTAGTWQHVPPQKARGFRGFRYCSAGEYGVDPV